MTTAEQIATGPYKVGNVVRVADVSKWPVCRNQHILRWFTQPEDARFWADELNAAYARGQQDMWSLEELERIMVHVGIAVAEYDPFPNQVDERDFLANIRDNLAIEYGLVPKPDPNGLVQWTTPHTP